MSLNQLRNPGRHTGSVCLSVWHGHLQRYWHGHIHYSNTTDTYSNIDRDTHSSNGTTLTHIVINIELSH